MKKISTLTYIINTYQNNTRKEEFFSEEIFNSFNDEMYQPAAESINAILNFASSYNVIETKNTGSVELNLN